ncbi:MAG: hypothetical protein AB8G17_06555 [Gammaproteobacteria bacterium]
MNNPYEPPKSATRPGLGELAWSQQSLFGAFFGGALGGFIGVAVWMMVVIVTRDNTILMGLFVAVCVGVFVRFNGRGLTLRYCLVGAAFAWVGVFAGIWFTGLRHASGLLLVVTLAGGIAGALARRPLDRDTQVSLWRWQNGIADDA